MGAGPTAGFTDGRPWLPVTETDAPHTVAGQRDDPASMLTLYRRLIALRRREPGTHPRRLPPIRGRRQPRPLPARTQDQRFLVGLNLGPEPMRVAFEGGRFAGTIEVSTNPVHEGNRFDGSLDLGPDEGVVIRVDG